MTLPIGPGGWLNPTVLTGKLPWLLGQGTQPTSAPTGDSGGTGGTEGTGGFLEQLFGGSMGFPLMLVSMFVVVYFLMIRPEQKRQKAREAMIQGVKKGDNVVTTAGIVAQVHRVEDKEVVLQVDRDSKTRVRFLKSAISEVLDGSSAKSEKSDKADKPTG